MSLVWSAPIVGPATHALVVGASDYQYLPKPNNSGPAETLGLTKLRSPALSAWRFYQWLLQAKGDFRQPLASVRLLCSPSSDELNAEPALAGQARPTFDNLKQAAWAWRKDLSDDDSVGVFFFSGHGLQADREGAILVLDDFCAPSEPLLSKAVRLANIRFGMTPSPAFPKIAQSQFYFIDACRDDPTKGTPYRDARPGHFFDDLNTRDVRNAYSFHATSYGKQTEGFTGEASYFTRALIKGLDSACYQSHREDGQLIWPVTAFALQEAIQIYLSDLGKPSHAALLSEAHGNAVIRLLKSPPKVDVTIEVSPETWVAATRVELRDGKQNPVQHFATPAPHPYTAEVPSGLYSLFATRGDGEAPSQTDLDWVTFISRKLSVEIQ